MLIFPVSHDGTGIFGGTVNTSNLISIGNEDQPDWTEGWSDKHKWYKPVDLKVKIEVLKQITLN
jgi:hypothetical protein